MARDLERRGLLRANRVNKQCHQYATLCPEAVTGIQMVTVSMDPDQ